MQNGGPAHRTKLITKWFKERDIPVLEWLGNSLDLNPIENVWNMMKNKAKKPNYQILMNLKIY